jgi:hypothetical protein
MRPCCLGARRAEPQGAAAGAGSEDGQGDDATFTEEDIRPPLLLDAPGGEGAAAAGAAADEQAPPLPQRSREELTQDFRDLLSEKVR